MKLFNFFFKKALIFVCCFTSILTYAQFDDSLEVTYTALYQTPVDGLIKVKNSNKKIGFTNSTGKVIIPVEFQENTYLPAANRVILSKDVQKYGVVDYQNQVIIPFRYKYIQTVIKGKLFSIREDGFKGQSALFDWDGKRITPFIYQNINPKKKIVIVTKEQAKGILNSKGEIILAPIYRNLEQIQNTSFYICKTDSVAKIIDLDTREIIFKNNYTDLNPLGGSHFMATKNGKQGLIDFNEDIIIPFHYDKIYKADVSNFIVYKNKKKGLYNIYSKKEILKPVYEILEFNADELVILGEKNKPLHLVRITGDKVKKILKKAYDEIKYISPYLCLVSKNNKQGIYNLLTGKFVLPVSFNSIKKTIGDDNYILKKDEKYYIYILLKNALIEKGFDEIYYSFDHHFFTCMADNQYSLYSNTGEKILGEYDKLDIINKDFIKFKTKDKYGIFSIYENKIILEPQYNKVVFNSINHIFSADESKFLFQNGKLIKQ